MKNAKDKWRLVVPSLVTLVGLVLSGVWLAGGPVLVGALGLLCDVLDGSIARKVGGESKFGSLLDWTVDVVVLAVLCGRLGLWPAALVLVPAQVALRHREVRFSGRAAVTLVVIALQVAGALKGWSWHGIEIVATAPK